MDKLKPALDSLFKTRPNFDFENIYEKTFAEEIAKAANGRLKFTAHRGWLVYDPLTGKFSSANGIERLFIAEMAKRFLTQGCSIRDQSKRTVALKFGAGLLKASGIAAIETLLRCERECFAAEDAFDAKPNEVNCSGIAYRIDGSSDPATPGSLFAKSCSVKPNGGDPARFLAFLDWFSCGNSDLKDWLLSVMGISVFGFPSSLIVNLYGGGANGKGTLLRLLHRLLGEYSTTLSRNIVVKSRYASSRFDKANLPGKRAAICFDLKIEPGEKLNLDDLKLIAGDGDLMPVERKGRDVFDAALCCKVFVASNEKIPIDSYGESERRRFRLVPCNAHVDEPDPGLETALEAEYPQILSLLIRYAVLWQNNGRKLPPCKAVDNATAAYFDNQDTLGMFLADRCVLGDGLRIQKKLLFAEYEKWLFSEQGVSKPGRMKSFASMLERRGIGEGILKCNGETARVFVGVAIKDFNTKSYEVTKKPKFDINPYEKSNIKTNMKSVNFCNLVTPVVDKTTIYDNEEQKKIWKDEESFLY